MTLTKAELAENLANKLHINKNSAKNLINACFEEIKAVLSSGESAKFSGFGNFSVRDKQPRPGRNPKTGEEVVVTARRVVTFHPGQKLRDTVERYSNKIETGN